MEEVPNDERGQKKRRESGDELHPECGVRRASTGYIWGPLTAQEWTLDPGKEAIAEIRNPWPSTERCRWRLVGRVSHVLD